MKSEKVKNSAHSRVRNFLEVTAGYSPMAKISHLSRCLASGHRLERRICAFHHRWNLAKRGEESVISNKAERVSRIRPEWQYRHSLARGARDRFKARSASPKERKRTPTRSVLFLWRCRPDLNRRITVLQTGALPLGYCTKF